MSKPSDTARSTYVRPLVQVGPARTEDALRLAGGWGWFSHIERLSRDAAPVIQPVDALSAQEASALTSARQDIAGMAFDRPRIMGIINATPDSFSDGGKHATVAAACQAAASMRAADILDVGGESTRPGAAFVDPAEEVERTAPIVSAMLQNDPLRRISIDTRKASVARAAVECGAHLINDVSGFTFDTDLAAFAARAGVPVCVMHAQGDPETMQKEPKYADVVLDVFDYLSDRIDALVHAGIPKGQIIADPGIGFGKTLEHNLALLARISIFHSLGVPILLGASRKRFIGTIGKEPQADRRFAGSMAVALTALQQGTQIVRVHDVAQTAQAIALWRASVAGTVNG